MKLVQEAFRPPKTPGGDAGPRWREELDLGESVAQMGLFKGAIGLFKNPPATAASTSPMPPRRSKLSCWPTCFAGC